MLSNKRNLFSNVIRLIVCNVKAHGTVTCTILIFADWEMARCHGSSFQQIDLAITSVTPLLVNQPFASQSERARDQPLVNLSFSFLSSVSRHLIYFIGIDS